LTAWIHQNLAELKRTKTQALESGSGLLGKKGGDSFRHLNMDAVAADYRKSKCRVIFLDNEGTLAPKAGAGLLPYGNPNVLRKDGTMLDDQVLDCLRLLAKDPCNSVVVISGRGPKFLDKTSLSEVEGLGLCAEYGFYCVDPGRLENAKKGSKNNVGTDRWTCMSASTSEDNDWKAIAYELMEMYAKRVQGSIVEYKGAAISWNYREVGAQIVAKEMALQLMRFLDPFEPEGLMRGYPVTVSSGKGYVEVKRSDINKGISVSRIMNEIQHHIGQIDFILCIGDDRSDEDMFEAVSEYSKATAMKATKEFNASSTSLAASPGVTALSSPRSDEAALPKVGFSKKASMTVEALEEAEKARNQKFYTVTVGRKRSKAGYFVQNVGTVSELLQKLTTQTTKAQFSRFQSMPNLAGNLPVADSDDD
jgi:trehalose 6-phosphate synthase/phosphatase